MWDIVWVSSQGHRSVSVRHQVFLQARSALDRYGNGKSETTLPDCVVVHQVGIDHWSQLPGFLPLTSDVGWSHGTP